MNIWEKVKTALQSFWQKVSEGCVSIWKKVSAFFVDLWQKIKGLFQKKEPGSVPAKPKKQKAPRPVKEPRKTGSNRFFQVCKEICSWIYTLRSLFLAIPVAVAAVLLALDNWAKLPASVALELPGLSKSGELILQTVMLDRSVAVLGPLAITAVCLLLMACSRRVVYPWIISIFSLVLPLFLMFTSVFPG